MKIKTAWLLLFPAAIVGLVIALAAAPLTPTQVPAPALMDDEPAEPEPGFTDEDYERHVKSLKKRLPGDGFTVVIQKPFVVIGDEAPARVRQRAEQTVQWASDKLKASYFASDPKHILDVWLFKDKVSYEQNAKKLFGGIPDTKYGYYSSHDRALVMNIATGGGTLVHEMVHAFMDGNFAECPPWFNEGLGSLYEQCRENDGKIEGLLNWRLPILKKAIRARRLPTIRTLTAMNTSQFYGASRGVNYAMARYLLYRLEREGLLRKLYRGFVENQKADPTGYATLLEILNTEDIEGWQKAWQKWVLDLER